MGLLKHAVLPLLAFFHVAVIYQTHGPGGPQTIIDAIMEGGYGRDLNAFPTTEIEEHIIAALAGAHLALLVNCIAAIFMENSHYRGVAVLLEFILWATDCYDTYIHGKDYTLLAVFTAVPLIGLIVHAMEPGIFTKDKNAKKTKSKRR